MKTHLRSPIENPALLAAIAGLLTMTISTPASFGGGDIEACHTVGKHVQARATDLPDEKLLVLVQDALIASDHCFCEIVQGAIVGSKASPEQVKAIVDAAAEVFEGSAGKGTPTRAVLVDCALAVAPEAAAAVAGKTDERSSAGDSEALKLDDQVPVFVGVDLLLPGGVYRGSTEIKEVVCVSKRPADNPKTHRRSTATPGGGIIPPPTSPMNPVP